MRRGRLRRMLDYLFVPALLALLVLAASCFDQAGLREVRGPTAVNDGDTITLGGERLRLRGIDAPELLQICSRGGSQYECGRSAREALALLIGNQPVSCSGWKRDRYGRLLATCETAQGADLNRLMVEQGWAIAYGDYDDAERKARAGKRGLWAGSFDDPQNWRMQHGGMAEIEPAWAAGLWNWLREVFGLPASSAYNDVENRLEGS